METTGKRLLHKSCQCKWWMQVKIAQYTRAGNNEWMNEWMSKTKVKLDYFV